MTTYLWLSDAAGETYQWPDYTPADVRLVAATRTTLAFAATIDSGAFAGERLRETYHGRFNLSGDTPAGRVGSIDVRIGGEPVLSARYDDPLRVRAYEIDFADRMTGDVWFRGNASSNWMETGAGNDSLAGGPGDDGLVSGGGRDRLFGGDGRDSLMGGPGADILVGGAGNDTYVVGRNDRMAEPVDGGRDTIAAPISFRLPINFEMMSLISDAISGWGNGTRNWLAGNEQSNALYGLAGGDALAGYAGADTLIGGLGNDSMLGGFGRDRLSGAAGDDVLEGGAHGDWLTGGAGADTFVFERPRESDPTLRDVISDFAEGDRIDLEAIDARSDQAGNDAFRYIGAQAFHDAPGELRYAGGRVSGDVDGDGVADFVIRVLDAPRLDAGDFVL